MIRDLGNGIHQLRGTLVQSYLLVDRTGVTLIDTGFLQHLPLFEKALSSCGLCWHDITAVLLTHGHLDHTFNLAQIHQHIDAPIYAHPGEAQHIAGIYPYQGNARVCGALEWAGRGLLGYQPVPLNHEIHDGQMLDHFGGLKVVHLPGHTEGHCGFYSRTTGILFSGDLFATSKLRTGVSWPWLNTCPERFADSLQKVIALNPDGILSNHCNMAGPHQQKRAFLNKFRTG